MNNLIPQKRLDKNGRLVTRHVKADQTVSKSMIPAPAAPYTAAQILDESDAAVNRVLNAFFTQSPRDSSMYVKRDGSAINYRAFKLLVGTLPNDTLNTLSEREASMPEMEKEIVTETLFELERRAMDMLGKTDYVEAMLHYSAELAPILTRLSDTPDSADQMHSQAMYINSLIASTFRGRDGRLMFADESEKSVVRGYTACYLITGEHKRASVPDLSWIGKNIDVISPYKDILRAHDRMDREFIQELLETDAPSLAGGYL